MKHLNVAIGFVTGRSNVCNIINTYSGYVKDQMLKFYKHTNITFYILYDLDYQNAKESDFYQINEEVLNDPQIKIKYITPQDIIKTKERMKAKYKMTDEMVDSIVGTGHARGRNTVMNCAYYDKNDYLLFWDDDEYPVACIKNPDGSIKWEMQDNVVKHIETMEKYDVDVTIGYHCGYISPIPYMSFEKDDDEMAINNFIKGISNEIITWESIKEKYENNNGVTFAEEDILNSEPYEMLGENGKKFVAGSTLCINLNHIDNIPAFFNPINARGEDTFFSIKLDSARVMKVPVYHFHDGFLKYKQIMQYKFPKKLRLIMHSEDSVEKRFYKACLGWIKYKPLLMYILEKDKYPIIIKDVYKNLEVSVPIINSLYPNCNFNDIIDALKEYDTNVEKDYQAFVDVNNMWDELKTKFYKE